MIRPILFSGPMVRALLDGRKTQTRRVMRPQPQHLQIHEHKGKRIYESEHRMWCWKSLVLDNIWDFPEGEDRRTLATCSPYGYLGDRLWVRESLRWDGERLIYDADNTPAPSVPSDANFIITRTHVTSMFMPRWASRITLKITDVRVQRLQEISHADAIAEGIVACDIPADEEGPRRIGYMVHPDDGKSGLDVRPQDSYQKLWDSINAKKHPWSSDLWVLAISFERVAP